MLVLATLWYPLSQNTTEYIRIDIHVLRNHKGEGVSENPKSRLHNTWIVPK